MLDMSAAKTCSAFRETPAEVEVQEQEEESPEDPIDEGGHEWAAD
ncbi:hypothetical protein [Nesterenkonia pannonica]|nr:hypothetical protein [Nesterenkonia pannonica]